MLARRHWGSVGLRWEAVSFYWHFGAVDCSINLEVAAAAPPFTIPSTLEVSVCSFSALAPLWAIRGAFHFKVHVSRQCMRTPESPSFPHLLPNGYTTVSRDKRFFTYRLLLWALIKTPSQCKSLLHYYNADSGGGPHSTLCSPQSYWKISHLMRLRLDLYQPPWCMGWYWHSLRS